MSIQKKSSILRKIVIGLSALMAAVIVIALLIPVLYKDEILAYARTAAEKNIQAEVAFTDAGLSLLRSFPDLHIRIDSLAITGRDTFDGIALLKTPSLSLDINLLSLFGEGSVPEISFIGLEKPEITVVILDSLQANYQIFPESSDTTKASFQLALESYQINNGTITYQDNTFPMLLRMAGVMHEGDGDITQDVFDLRTTTTADSLSLTYDGTTYLNNATCALDADINMNVPEQKITFRENTFRLNALQGAFNGFFQLRGDDIVNDIQFSAPEDDFRAFLSIIPGAYTPDFKDVTTSGKASINGTVKGIYSEALGQMPAFSVGILVRDGAVQYPSLPERLSNIQADLLISASKPDYSDLSFQVKTFSLNCGSETLSGRLLASNLTGNQKVEGDLTARLQLASLSKAVPLPAVTSAKGRIEGRLQFNASMDDINAARYDKISFAGSMTATDVRLQLTGKPDVSIPLATLAAAPDRLTITCQRMALGQSDVSFSLKADNPLAVFSAKTGPSLTLEAQSGYFNADEWMSASPAAAPPTPVAMSPPSAALKDSKMSIDLSCREVKMSEQRWQNLSIRGKLAANHMQLDQLAATMGENDLALSGYVSNAWDYLFDGGTLEGQLRIKSRYLNLNPWMNNPGTPSNSPAAGIIPIPERVRLKAEAQIDKLQYTAMTMTNVSGLLDVSAGKVALRGLQMGVLGGRLGLEGLYQTPPNAKPDFSVRLDMADMPFQQAAMSFESIAMFAPVAKNMQGFFNATFVMSGFLKENMMPVWQSINASGFLETLDAVIRESPLLVQLSEQAGLKELKEIHLKDTRNWFDIVDGTVDLKEFRFTEKDIDVAVAGKLSLSKDIDFTFAVAIPREKLQGNAITAAASNTWRRIETEAGKLGVNIKQGPTIQLKINVSGKFPNLKWKVTPVRSTGTVTTQDDETDTGILTDTLRKTIEEKGKEIKDSVINTATREAEKVRKKAEEEAERRIDSARSKIKKEAERRIDSLGKGLIPDTLRNKAKDVLNKKTTEEVDKIKDKIKDFNPFKKKNGGE